jgi:hypothetical protein
MTRAEIIARLSDDAKAVAVAWFAMGPNSRLTFHMREGGPSERAQAGLDELVAAGLLKTTDEYPPPAVTYRPTKAAGQAFAPLRAWAAERLGDPSLHFPLTVRIDRALEAQDNAR